MEETKKLIKVFSHPRSGTNYLAALLASNFYKDEDLSSKPGKFGHWRSRSVLQESPHGKLIGNHVVFDDEMTKPMNAVYIYRDGRDVAVSLWRTKAMLSPEQRLMTLPDFLRSRLDWCGSPGYKNEYYYKTIFEHWKDHLESWRKSGVYMIRYEDLLTISKRQDILYSLYPTIYGVEESTKNKLVTQNVNKLVGPRPHNGIYGSWKRFMKQKDIELYKNIVGDFWGTYGK